MLEDHKFEKFLWHPFTQHGLSQPILPVRSASGAYLELESGQRVFDGISSWWVNLHGHGHPQIVQAITEQARCLDHVLFAGFTHAPAQRLAKVLIEAARESAGCFDRAFYSDNGSTAVEVALKLAYQFYWNTRGERRTRFLALKNAYHGDTFGAMSVGEPSGFHATFRSLCFHVDFVEPGDLGQMESHLRKRPGEYAAFIFEPLVQGAGGMKIYPAQFAKQAIELCRRNDVLSIGDEIFTGFYRTGSLFAFSQIGSSPDLLCLSKGITGGILPLAATLVPEPIFEAFLSDKAERAFLHGHSYTANPIACASGLASWKILSDQECQTRIRSICEVTQNEMNRLSRRHTVRSLGTIGVVEVPNLSRTFASRHSKARSFHEDMLRRGILLRPLGDVIYVVPPYCSTPAEIEKVYQMIEEALGELSQ